MLGCHYSQRHMFDSQNMQCITKKGAGDCSADMSLGTKPSSPLQSTSLNVEVFLQDSGDI